MKKQLLFIAGAALLFSACSKSGSNNVVPGTSSAASTAKVAAKRGDEGKALSGSLNYAFTDAFDMPCVFGSYTPVGNLSGIVYLQNKALRGANIFGWCTDRRQRGRGVCDPRCCKWRPGIHKHSPLCALLYQRHVCIRYAACRYHGRYRQIS